MLTSRLLTAEDFDAGGVQVVLGPDQGPHADDEQVAEAGDEGHDPDGHAQHHVGQQVLDGRDAVRVGLARADVGRVGAVLERVEVAESGR